MANLKISKVETNYLRTGRNSEFFERSSGRFYVRQYKWSKCSKCFSAIAVSNKLCLNSRLGCKYTISYKTLTDAPNEMSLRFFGIRTFPLPRTFPPDE